MIYTMNKYRCISSAIGLAITFTACSEHQQEGFTISGAISGAEGQILYLEEVGTGNVLSLDSTKLDARGTFEFKRRGTSYPMFYSLRLGSAGLPFAADSLTRVRLESDGSAFFTKYKLLEADPFNHQIREIAMLRYTTDGKIDSVQRLYHTGAITPLEESNAVDSLATAFKSYLLSHYIYVDPKSPAAYFALYQSKGDIPYFSIYGEGDDRAFAAVATAYEMFHSQAPYLPFLKDQALKALAIRRMRKEAQGERRRLTDSIKP